MKYRLLGKTGWKVSVLGLGASPLGGAFGTVDEKEGVKTVMSRNLPPKSGMCLLILPTRIFSILPQPPV